MELRVLEYFLAVAKEENITRAAAGLHLTQPTLSRQLSDLEQEFGKKLLVRGKRRVTLTEDGRRFRRRAEEIVSLAKRTETEMKNADAIPAGDIFIGTGESPSIRNIIRVARTMQNQYPDLHFHFTSGNAGDLTERLDNGLFDFCILFGDVDRSKYEYLVLPYAERWGALMRQDMPLAQRTRIETQELWGQPLILSAQTLQDTQFTKWLGKSPQELCVNGTYNLIYTGILMAQEGMGYVLTLENLVNTAGTDLRFVPLCPLHQLSLTIVWKKNQLQTKAAELFLSALKACSEESEKK